MQNVDLGQSEQYSPLLVPHSELSESLISLSLNTEVTSNFPHV